MEISIQKPCHENWDTMTPNEQGAFCGKCVKTVVDFSHKSIEEIKEFFIGKQNEKVCGRFEKTQLTSLSFDAFYNEFKGFHFTKRSCTRSKKTIVKTKSYAKNKKKEMISKISVAVMFAHLRR